MYYSDSVYETATASNVQLQGKENERGTYECRWKNSKGETKHRNFTVSISFFEPPSDIHIIAVSVTLIGLLVVGTGIGVKFYRDKVRNKKIKYITQLTKTRIISTWQLIISK